MELAPIHQSPEQKQANATRETTNAVNAVHDAVREVSRNKATSSDIKEVVKAIENIPKPIEPKEFPSEIAQKLDNIETAIKEIPRTEIPAQKDFPEFPEIKPTDMTETNNLLRELLKKEQKFPEYPVPEFPSIPKTDLSKTENLLQKLLERDEEISISAELNIV